MKKSAVAAMIAALIATGAFAQDETPAEDTAQEETTPEAPAAAEDQDAEAPAAAEEAPAAGQADALGLSMGLEEPQVGEMYVREEFDDWAMRCIRTEAGNDPCQLHQLLYDDEGNSVADISIVPMPPGGEVAAAVTIVTPLETLLTAPLALQVDAGQVKRYPYSVCTTIGCYSRIGFSAEDVASFRRGRSATMTIRPFRAPDQTVDLTISLAGFTAAQEAVAEANAAAQEAAEGE